MSEHHHTGAHSGTSHDPSHTHNLVTHDASLHSSHHNHPSKHSTHHPTHTDPNTPMHPTNAEANTNTFASHDPTTDPHAKSSSKIMGDIKGALHGTVGSMQAATGTAFGMKGMKEKGFQKMSEEDARLAQKSGKVPVGTETRDRVESVGQGTAATGHGAAEEFRH